MAHGDGAELIRERAWTQYIQPRLLEGQAEIAVKIRLLMREMEAEGFPTNQPRLFCKALQKNSFLREKGLRVRVEGPPSGTSTTVVLHFTSTGTASPATETPAERAHRLTEKLRGLMKNEIAARGGTEGFLRWVRSDEDEDEAA
jgi:hypothetical protein